MNWKLGHVAGIPINIHWSFWLLPLFVLMSTGPLDGSLAMRMLLLAGIFGCVILHELGHALTARLFHVQTRDITIYPIGGVASLERMPRSPLAEGTIALAGPAVNVVLIIVLSVLQWVAAFSVGPIVTSFLHGLVVANLVLAMFNLLPIFPLDGGRVLRALLGLRLPYLRATEIAARIGKVCAVLLGILGLFTSGSLVLIAVFIYFAAQAELTMVRLQWQQAARPVVNPVASVDPLENSQGRRPYVLLDNHGKVITTY